MYRAGVVHREHWKAVRARTTNTTARRLDTEFKRSSVVDVTVTTNSHHRFYIYVRRDPGIDPFDDIGAEAIHRIIWERCVTIETETRQKDVIVGANLASFVCIVCMTAFIIYVNII